MCSNCETEANIHTGRVAFHRHFDVPAHTRKLDDAFEFAAYLGASHLEHRAMQVHILHAREFGMKSGTYFHQGGKAAADRDFASGGCSDPSENFQYCFLA